MALRYDEITPVIDGQELWPMPVIWDVKFDRVMREPFSWGGSRGSYNDAEVTLRTLTVGDLSLDRAQVILMCGQRFVELVEESAADRYAEESDE